MSVYINLSLLKQFSYLLYLQLTRLILQQNSLRWHVLRKEDTDWVKKCMEYDVEGSRPRGRPKSTWKEVVHEDCQARNLNKGDAIDRGRWKKLIKIG